MDDYTSIEMNDRFRLDILQDSINLVNSCQIVVAVVFNSIVK